MEGILERSGELGMKVLNVMGDKPDVYGKMGTEFKELLSSLKTEQDSDEWKEILQVFAAKVQCCPVIRQDQNAVCSSDYSFENRR